MSAEHISAGVSGRIGCVQGMEVIGKRLARVPAMLFVVICRSRFLALRRKMELLRSSGG